MSCWRIRRTRGLELVYIKECPQLRGCGCIYGGLLDSRGWRGGSTAGQGSVVTDETRKRERRRDGIRPRWRGSSCRWKAKNIAQGPARSAKRMQVWCVKTRWAKKKMRNKGVAIVEGSSLFGEKSELKLSVGV